MAVDLATLEQFSPRQRREWERVLRYGRLANFIATLTPKHAPIPVHLARLIQVLERAAVEPVRVLVSMPPRHGKSVTLTHALAWMVERFPDQLNAYVTYAVEKARPRGKRAMDLAQQAGVALNYGASSQLNWRTKHGGGLISTGIGGGLTGDGIDKLLVVDDPIKDREAAESPLQRDKVWDWFNDVAYTRLNKGASCVVVATRWHMDDLIGRLQHMDNSPWEVLNLPALADEDGNPTDDDDVAEALWPEMFPARGLRDTRKQVGPYTWSSLYQGQPVPRAGRVFSTAYGLYTGDPAALRNGRRISIAIDPAGTEDTRSDHTAIVVLAFEGHGADEKAYVLEVLRFQRSTHDASQLASTAAQVKALRLKYGVRGVAYEATRDGKAIVAALKKIDAQVRCIEIKPIGDKYSRAQPVATAWNQGRVLLPPDDGTHPWVTAFLDEALKFTGAGDKHDDQVDALAHAWNRGTRSSSGSENVKGNPNSDGPRLFG